MSAQNSMSYIQFGKEHGKSFRIVKTPSGAATDAKTGEVLPDSPTRWSIVTPENGEAFNWPKADKNSIKAARKSWGKFQADPESQYKVDQIRRSRQAQGR
jgi:hypothetical protein